MRLILSDDDQYVVILTLKQADVLVECITCTQADVSSGQLLV